MSKIIKSGQCVETHPRQLVPIDVDVFINNAEEEEAKKLFSDLESNMEGDKTLQPDQQELSVPNGEVLAPETEAIPDLENEVETKMEEQDSELHLGLEFLNNLHLTGFKKAPQEVLEDEPSAVESENIDLNRVADIAESIGSFIADNQEATSVTDEKSPIDLHSILQDANLRTAETVDTANRKAKEIAFNAHHEAHSIIEGASAQAGTTLENAKSKATAITSGAQQEAGTIVHHANQKAESIMQLAKDQAELVVEGSRQQSEKLLERAKKQVETIVRNAKRQAELTNEQAKEQADKLLEDSIQESIKIKEDAQKEGIELGRREAITLVKQELSEQFNQALALFHEVENERMQRLASSEPELLKLAVHIAEKIIGAELKLHPDQQIAIVKEALAKVASANTITLKINPEDLKVIQENITVIQNSLSEPKPIKIQDDSSIAPGSCFLETEHGNVDARIKSQLDRIMKELLKVGQIE